VNKHLNILMFGLVKFGLDKQLLKLSSHKQSLEE